VYLTASLVAVHAPQLLGMHAASIKSWFEAVAANCEDWFTHLSKAAPQSSSPPPSSWEAFSKGWIRATSGTAC